MLTYWSNQCGMPPSHISTINVSSRCTCCNIQLKHIYSFFYHKTYEKYSKERSYAFSKLPYMTLVNKTILCLMNGTGRYCNYNQTELPVNSSIIPMLQTVVSFPYSLYFICPILFVLKLISKTKVKRRSKSQRMTGNLHTLDKHLFLFIFLHHFLRYFMHHMVRFHCLSLFGK